LEELSFSGGGERRVLLVVGGGGFTGAGAEIGGGSSVCLQKRSMGGQEKATTKSRLEGLLGAQMLEPTACRKATKIKKQDVLST